MGSVAAWAYARAPGIVGDAGIPGFGEPAPSGLAPGLDMARVAAGDAAFAAVALVTALLCLLSAITAWVTAPGSVSES